MTTKQISAVSISLMVIAALAAIVLVAIGANRLGDLIGGIAVGGAILILAGWMIARNIVVPLLDAKTKRDGMRYDFLQNMASKGALPNDGSFIPLSVARQIAPPAAPPQDEIDPRHALLVSLCLLTIKSADYGPVSKRLMTADDAQADRSGQFADRMKWDAASKYGQDVGLIFKQVGGPPKEQGMKVKGGGTVADLLVSLHERDLILDSAINALPQMVR